jgi:hypothetical protein
LIPLPATAGLVGRRRAGRFLRVLYAFLVVAALAADSMTVELSIPDHVRAGAAVPLTIRATNHGATPTTLYLRGRPIAFDVIVTDTRGTIVWRRLKGAITSMVLQVRQLAPDETLTLEDVWSQRTNAGALVAPGEYHLKAQLLTDSAPLETPVVLLHIDR